MQEEESSDDEVVYAPDELYDENADDDDEDWIEQKLAGKSNDYNLCIEHAGIQMPKSTASMAPETVNTLETDPSLPQVKTDAYLACPFCFTPLCFDCQQHDKYKSQYRAMFVQNCRVNKEQRLTYGQDVHNKERYHPVQCMNCQTEVAVFDKDEVYHFFNVLAS